MTSSQIHRKQIDNKLKLSPLKVKASRIPSVNLKSKIENILSDSEELTQRETYYSQITRLNEIKSQHQTRRIRNLPLMQKQMKKEQRQYVMDFFEESI